MLHFVTDFESILKHKHSKTQNKLMALQIKPVHAPIQMETVSGGTSY